MNTAKKNNVRVKDIAGLIEKFAPLQLSEEWDNCGLQVGDNQWPVKKIRIALDPLMEVMADAERDAVDMVITHHPLIFKGLKRIDLASPEGRVIASAVSRRIAIYTAHTNLDSTAGGINDVLAQKIGLHNLSPMVVAKSGAGLDESAINPSNVGIGRIGDLKTPRAVDNWIDEIKKQLGIQHVKAAGNIERVVSRAAVCSGSGGSLLGAFLSSDADVFVTGDLRYHDARAVEDAGRTFLDIGHFASEHIILDELTAKLTSAVDEAGWHVEIDSCRIERDPFEII